MFVTDSSSIEAATLWDLCSALWGVVVADDIVSETSYPCQLARREAVSRWLTSCAVGNINTEIQLADMKAVCVFVLYFVILALRLFCIHMLVFDTVSYVDSSETT